MMALILSLPNDWRIYTSQLRQFAKTGKASTMSVMNELIRAGYVHRDAIRDKKGRMCGYDYTIYENKKMPKALEKQAINAELTENQFPDYGEPNNGKANNGKPDTTKYCLNESLNERSTEPAVPSYKPSSKPKKHRYMEFVTLATDEYFKLKAKFGRAGVREWCEALNLWKGSKGKKTASDYLTILDWDRRDRKKQASGQNTDLEAQRKRTADKLKALEAECRRTP
jgi:hypothetical protein